MSSEQDTSKTSLYSYPEQILSNPVVSDLHTHVGHQQTVSGGNVTKGVAK